MSTTSSTTRRRRVVLLTAALASTLSVAACASSGATTDTGTDTARSQPGTASAHLGKLSITGGYIPQPASPDVAAAYFTVTNSGSVPDTLTKVRTDITNSVMAMDETDAGTSGSMTDLPAVVVPAHGSFRFSQGHAHLMLQDPSRQLHQGDKVSMTLSFAHAGTVRLMLPVVSFTGPSNDGASMSPMSGMSGMDDMTG